MSDLKLSLVIPAYNEEKYLAACLEAAQKNGQFFEGIVVDNASTDQTRAIAERFPRFRVVSEPSKGLTKARQRGLTEATGDIIAYIDADSLLCPGWVDHVLAEYKKDPDTVCVSGTYVYKDVSWLTSGIVWLYWNVLAYAAYLVTGYMVIGGNFAARKSALLEIGGFDTKIAFFGEDSDIARRLHRVGKVKLLPQIHVVTSPRRLNEEGLVHMGYIYIKNFLSIVLKGKPATAEYKDFR